MRIRFYYHYWLTRLLSSSENVNAHEYSDSTLRGLELSLVLRFKACQL